MKIMFVKTDQDHGVTKVDAKSSVPPISSKDNESSVQDADKGLIYSKMKSRKHPMTKFGVERDVDHDLIPTNLKQPVIMKCNFKSLPSLLEDVAHIERLRLYRVLQPNDSTEVLWRALAEVLVALLESDMKPLEPIMKHLVVEPVDVASDVEEQQTQRIKITFCEVSERWKRLTVEAASEGSSNEGFLAMLRMAMKYIHRCSELDNLVEIEINDSLQKINGEFRHKPNLSWKLFGDHRRWFSSLSEDLRQRKVSRPLRVKSLESRSKMKVVFHTNQHHHVSTATAKSSVVHISFKDDESSSHDIDKELTSTTHMDFRDVKTKSLKRPVTKFGVERNVDHDEIPTNLKQPVIMKCSFKSLPSLLEDVTDIKKLRSLQAAIEFSRALSEVLVALLEPDMKPPEPIIKHLVVEPVDVASKVRGEQQTQRIKITLCEERYGWSDESDQRNKLIVEAESGANSNEGFLDTLIATMQDYHRSIEQECLVEIEINDSLQNVKGKCRDQILFHSPFSSRFHRTLLWFSSLRKELLQKKVSLLSSAHKVPTDTSSESSKDFLLETSGDSVETSQLQGTKIIDRTSSVVGPVGGVVKVGGCQLLIPDGALESEVTIELESVYGGNDEMDLLTPILKCEPHGLKFLKKVVVLLYTCYINDVRATVEVRRSEDGEHWENIKQFHHTNDRFFEFSIKGFSWFSTFFANRQRRRKSRIRKSLTYWIPSDAHTSFTKQLRCFVDDDIPGVRRTPPNPESEWTLVFFAKKNEEDVKISLSLEDPQQSRDLTISPASRDINVYERPRHETSFMLKWENQNGELYEMNVSVETTIDKIPQPFYIRSPLPASVEENQSSGNPTRVVHYDTTINSSGPVAVGTESTLNMPSTSTDNSTEQ